MYNVYTISAQELMPNYSDYLTDNLYLLYPSMAGAANYNQVRLTARRQWLDVADAPNLQTISANGKIGDRVGIGGIFFRDENGYTSKLAVYGTFAYHLMFSRDNIDLNQLSFGINVGLIQKRLDESEFVEFDPIFGNQKNNEVFANIDVGLSYYYLDFYAHIAAKNLLNVYEDISSPLALPTNQRKYLASLGYVFSLENDWSLEPSTLFQYLDFLSQSTLDVNLKTYKKLDFGKIWGGFSYRYSFDSLKNSISGVSESSRNLQYLTPFVGITYKQFLVGYTYSNQLNSMVISNSGFHQITLGYNFGKNRQRYDCECPAIN